MKNYISDLKNTISKLKQIPFIIDNYTLKKLCKCKEEAIDDSNEIYANRIW